MARILRGEIRWADLNPARGREQAGRRPVLILSQDETRRLLLMAPNLKTRVLLSLAYGTGLRVGEVVSVQVIPRPHEDLDIALGPAAEKSN